MKRFNLIAALSLSVTCFTGCEKEEDSFIVIEGITFENYPRMDGSTSAEPLNTLIACKLLGWRYEWRSDVMGGLRRLAPNLDDMPDPLFFGERVKSSQTHNSIVNLIDGRTDLVISARKMSQDEQTYAESVGVSLIETSVTLDALDFLLHISNPIQSLTVQQIQDIYLGKITNWNEVGGAGEAIKPFIRNANSGSQEMMKEIVMNHAHAEMPEWEMAWSGDEILWSMASVYSELSTCPNGICFTPHYYREYIVRDAVIGIDGGPRIKTVAINGITPEKKSIAVKTYPYVAPVYVFICSGLDRNSMAYKMYEWLQTQAGKHVIAESGYVPM